jgi:exodeoxyribonuclease-3
VRFDIPGFADEQKRVIAATIGGVRIVCAYMPNGQAVGSDKYDYKLRWLAALQAMLREDCDSGRSWRCWATTTSPRTMRDVHDPVAWKDQILCSEPERAAFRSFLDLGLSDAFRLFEQAPKSYSWWDYRQMGFRLNRGLRIDHILLSAPLAAACRACVIDKAPRKLERPSDHAPVLATLAGPEPAAP